MKNLLLILALFIGLNSLGQSDTTVFFTDEVEDVIIRTLLRESEYKTLDTINFTPDGDSTLWSNSTWIQIDSIYVNSKTYKIREKQERMNQQGIKQRHTRTIRYTNESIRKRRIR